MQPQDPSAENRGLRMTVHKRIIFGHQRKHGIIDHQKQKPGRFARLSNLILFLESC